MLLYPKFRIFFTRLFVLATSQSIVLSIYFKNWFLFIISSFIFLVFLLTYIWLTHLKIELTNTHFSYQSGIKKHKIELKTVHNWEIKTKLNYEGIRESYLYLYSEKTYKLSLYQFKEHKKTIENYFKENVVKKANV